jgi:hypothetical protein
MPGGPQTVYVPKQELGNEKRSKVKGRSGRLVLSATKPNIENNLEAVGFHCMLTQPAMLFSFCLYLLTFSLSPPPPEAPIIDILVI